MIRGAEHMARRCPGRGPEMRNPLGCRGFVMRMRLRGRQAAGAFAVLCAAVLAWAAPTAGAAGSGCTAHCPATSGQHGSKLAELRRQNARQKRPNVIVIDTD